MTKTQSNTLQCPKCHQEIKESIGGVEIELAMRCPNCGHFPGVQEKTRRDIIKAIIKHGIEEDGI